jgi:hypothetical protein
VTGLREKALNQPRIRHSAISASSFAVSADTWLLDTSNPHNAGQRGVEYITKMIGTLEAEWDFNWLHLFNPAIERTPKLDHHCLRRDRRWQQQLTQSTQGQQPSGVHACEPLFVFA